MFGFATTTLPRYYHFTGIKPRCAIVIHVAGRVACACVREGGPKHEFSHDETPERSGVHDLTTVCNRMACLLRAKASRL